MDTGKRHEVRSEDVVRASGQRVQYRRLLSARVEQGFSGTKIKKSDIGWAKAGSAQLGFRGAIGMRVVMVTARVFLRVPCRLVLDLQWWWTYVCMSWPAVDELSLGDAHICRHCHCHRRPASYLAEPAGVRRGVLSTER